MRSSRDRRATFAFVVLLFFSAAATARADDAAEAAEAEALVSARYYDSVPYRQMRALTAAGVARLAELLADPSATDLHPNAILALGVCGRDGAFEALAEHAARVPEGEVTGAVYRSRVALRIAMGHLARSDDRALTYLVDAFERGPARANWRYSILDEDKIARKLRRDAASGLATSGRPEARTALAGMIAGGRVAASYSELDAHVDAMLVLHQRVARDGADAVFGGDR